MIETPVFDGDRLQAGNVITPPAIIEEQATTIVIFPGSLATVSEQGHYLVRINRN